MKHPPGALGFLDEALAGLSAKGLLRTRPTPVPDGEVSFSSNDYLGLASRTAPTGPSGAGASRLVAGERRAHRDLELDVAAWLGAEAALVFTSGYAANVGALSALARSGDLVISDELNHASLIDGARLSRANLCVVPHADVGAVERALGGPRQGRAWVVTESYFSMDADSPDLRGLRAVCDRGGAALVVDEAHALGVLGPGGRGVCAECDVVPDVLTGTFGKAFGAGGAFVAGSEALASWLWNRARSFVFSTGLSPVVAEAARAGVRTAREEPARREATLRAAMQLRAGLRELGLTPLGYGHVIPWVIGAPERTTRLAAELTERGVRVTAIRPPSVPAGTSRLRLTVTARHTDHDVRRALAAIGEALECVAP